MSQTPSIDMSDGQINKTLMVDMYMNTTQLYNLQSGRLLLYHDSNPRMKYGR
jgi:hypothetical protein